MSTTEKQRDPSICTPQAIKLHVRFDSDNRIWTVSVEPDDLGLFDHVISMAMADHR